MKKFRNGMFFALALVLALVMGAMALAENVSNESHALPAAGELQGEADEQPAGDAQQNDANGQQPAAEAAGDGAALNEALEAYRQAKASDRQEALEAELKGYVESGKLTQEQADLILQHFQDRQSQRGEGRMNGKDGRGNGRPDAQSGAAMNGKGNGRMNGKGGRMNGQMNGRMGGQQPAEGAQSNGMPMQPGAQGMAFQPDNGDI